MSSAGLRAVVIVVLAFVAGGCAPLTVTVGGAGDERLRSTVVHREAGMFAQKIAVIDVSGLMINAHKPALLRRGENPVSLLQEKLNEARDDRRVRAVILRLNTPGGTVTASDAMYREVVRFRRETGKPVIALMMDVAASGGYYLACAGDEIVAYPTTVTGSIGVIVQTLSVKPALGRLGIQAETLTSGINKDAGSPLSVMTADHRAVLQRLVDDFYAGFVDVVRANRPNIPPERFAAATDGRVVSGQDAVDLGLVDRLGDLYDAFELAKERAGIERANLVVYHRPYDYMGSVYASSTAGAATAGVGTQVNLLQVNLPELLSESPVGFYYLWSPELSAARP